MKASDSAAPKAPAKKAAPKEVSNGQANGQAKERQKEAALAALLASPTIAGAAQKANISEATLLRWLKSDEAFKEEYRAARRELVSHAITSLQRQSGGAVAVLCSIAADKEAPASSRVSAAKTILDMAIRAVELDDLAARVEALESVLQAQGEPNGQPDKGNKSNGRSRF